MSEEEKMLDELGKRSKPVTGGCAIMCCGCISVMQQDGSTRKWKISKSQPDAATFSSGEEADKAAIALGWSVEDGNHRCRECTAKMQVERMSEMGRRGAVVPAGWVR